MPSQDETVVHAAVVTILNRVKAEGWRRAMERLEQEEPVLAGFAYSAAYQLERTLGSLRLPRRVHLVIESEMMTAQIVCIESMRQASRLLWSDFLPTLGPNSETE